MTKPDRGTRTAPDEAYAVLREKIVQGTYLPSQRLVEAQVAKDLRMGRYAIRNAIGRLQLEGLVTLEPNRGATVTSLTLEDTLDTLEARAYLEGAAAGLAADRATPAQLENLAACLADLRNALGAGDFDRYSASNRRFHGVIYAASGNRSLPQLVEVLKARILRLQLRTMLVPGRSDRSLAEHMALYDAIARGDVDGAERAARAHMSGLRETIAGAWNLVRS